MMNETAPPIITQSNRLISSSYQMSLNEKRVIIFILAKISPKDKDFQEYKIPVKEFSEMFSLSLNATYSRLRESCKKLQKTIITFPKDDNDNEEEDCTFFTNVIRTKDKSYVKIKVNPTLKPYLLELKKLFTSYQLPNVLYMKSAVSIRCYELLKSEEYKNKPFEITIEKLKFILNIENKYQLYSHLRQRILEPSIGEINDHTDLQITYEPKKKSRKVVGLVFHIKKNPSQQMKMYLPLPDDDGQFVYDSLIHQFQFSKTETNKILRENRSPPELLADTIRYVLEMMSTTEIRKPKPYLLKCLKDDVLKPEREERTEKKKKEEEREHIQRLTALWKNGKGTPEIEKQIESFYEQVGHPLFRNWKSFV